MDRQLYQELIQYLSTLTFMDGITDKRKNYIRKNSTQYIYQNNTLFRRYKKGNPTRTSRTYFIQLT